MESEREIKTNLDETSHVKVDFGRFRNFDPKAAR